MAQSFSIGEPESIRSKKLNNLDTRVQALEAKKITVGTSPPSNPSVNDLWIDTN